MLCFMNKIDKFKTEKKNQRFINGHKPGVAVCPVQGEGIGIALSLVFPS